MNDEWPKKRGALVGPCVVWLQKILAKSEMTGKNASSRKSKRAKASKRGVKIVALLNKKNRQEHICTVKIQKQAQKKTN